MQKAKELALLNAFTGCWKTEGTLLPAEGRDAVKVWGTDTYDWLPGGYFLLHKVDVYVGDDKNETIEIIGFDKAIGQYTMQHYDNKGNTGFMTATCHDGRWTFLGATLKFTGGFNENESEFAGVWEQASDGKNWNPFMNINLTRTK